jgi:hypothetical protein
MRYVHTSTGAVIHNSLNELSFVDWIQGSNQNEEDTDAADIEKGNFKGYDLRQHST